MYRVHVGQDGFESEIFNNIFNWEDDSAGLNSQQVGSICRILTYTSSGLGISCSIDTEEEEKIVGVKKLRRVAQSCIGFRFDLTAYNYLIFPFSGV